MTLSCDYISSPDKSRTSVLVTRTVPSSGVLAIQLCINQQQVLKASEIAMRKIYLYNDYL